MDPLSQVRQKLGDTDPARPEVYDETINAYLGRGLSILSTAATLAGDLAAKYAKRADAVVDHQQLKFSNIAQSYRALATSLWAQARSQIASSDDEPVGSSIIVTGCDNQPPFVRGYGWDC